MRVDNVRNAENFKMFSKNYGNISTSGPNINLKMLSENYDSISTVWTTERDLRSDIKSTATVCR
jgi:hypothetical protein